MKAKTVRHKPQSDKKLLDGLQEALDGNGSLVIDKNLDPEVTSVREALDRFLDTEQKWAKQS